MASRKAIKAGTDSNLLSKTNVFVLTIILLGIVACPAAIIISQENPSPGKDYAPDAALMADNSNTVKDFTASTAQPSTTITPPSSSTTSTSPTVPTTSTTSTSLTSSTTTSSTTSTSTSTSTTSTSSTTTIPCGGNRQPACKKNVESNGCDKGNILGHDDLCHIPCVQSVPSGKDNACGAFALSFCTSGLGYAP